MSMRVPPFSFFFLQSDKYFGGWRPLRLRRTLCYTVEAARSETGASFGRNAYGNLYQRGKPTPLTVRGKIVEVCEASLLEKAMGGPGKTWDEIVKAVNGPSMRCCQNIWNAWLATGTLSAKQTQSHAATTMDDAAVLFLIDLQRKNGAYQLRDYVDRLRVDIGVVVHESSLCRIFQNPSPL